MLFLFKVNFIVCSRLGYLEINKVKINQHIYVIKDFKFEIFTHILYLSYQIS